jgi:hypothetical protein
MQVKTGLYAVTRGSRKASGSLEVVSYRVSEGGGAQQSSRPPSSPHRPRRRGRGGARALGSARLQSLSPRPSGEGVGTLPGRPAREWASRVTRQTSFVGTAVPTPTLRLVSRFKSAREQASRPRPPPSSCSTAPRLRLGTQSAAPRPGRRDPDQPRSGVRLPGTDAADATPSDLPQLPANAKARDTADNRQEHV